MRHKIYGRKWGKKRNFRIFLNLQFFSIFEGFRKQFLFSVVWRFFGTFWEWPSNFKNETALVKYVFSRGRIVVSVQKNWCFYSFLGFEGPKICTAPPFGGGDSGRKSSKLIKNFNFSKKSLKLPQNIFWGSQNP